MHLKKTFIISYNRSNSDYHFSIKELAEEFQKQFTCLGAYKVPIEKEVTRIDKSGDEITKIMSYRLKFMESARFMASSLSNLVNNLSKGIHKIKCKYGHNY